MDINKLVQELIELEKKRVILLEKIAESDFDYNTHREIASFTDMFIEPTSVKYDMGICENCIYKGSINCQACTDDMHGLFGKEGWDDALLRKYDNRQSMAKAAGKCKLYCDDTTKFITCVECKHCIPGEKGPCSIETGECLIGQLGGYDDYDGCPYGERK